MCDPAKNICTANMGSKLIPHMTVIHWVVTSQMSHQAVCRVDTGAIPRLLQQWTEKQWFILLYSKIDVWYSWPIGDKRWSCQPIRDQHCAMIGRYKWGSSHLASNLGDPATLGDKAINSNISINNKYHSQSWEQEKVRTAVRAKSKMTFISKYKVRTSENDSGRWPHLLSTGHQHFFSGCPNILRQNILFVSC